jgi:spoIIIJ-associated protein
MEWVETTGRTVEEAKEAALDELGVDEADAEFEVIAEAQTGLFGRLRSEARVRARVKPTAPRAKEDRRDRRRRGGQGGRSGPANEDTARTTSAAADVGASEPNQAEPGSAASASSATSPSASTPSASTFSGAITASSSAVEQSATDAGAQGEGEAGRPARSEGATATVVADEATPRQAPNGRRRQRSRGNSRGTEMKADNESPQPNGAEVEVPLDEQARIAEDFLARLTAEFGLSASVAIVHPDDETVELQLSGSDLGLLIGPKGATLVAIQNLTRTVVFHETGATNGHLNVDVGGYRHKRTEALVRFARQVASAVKENGARTALEPMSAVDRKVVHDAIAEIDGVTTVSEGEEPRRRVVVLPASGPSS